MSVGSYLTIWPIFGTANQMLAALSLLAIAAWLRKENRKTFMVTIPMYFMFAVTFCSLGQLIYANLGKNWLIVASPPVWLFWVAVALVGFGNSNVFSLFLSHALMYRPDRQNEISGLMLMGLIGGAIFPPIMGAAADVAGQFGGILVMAIGCLYVLVVGFATRCSKAARNPWKPDGVKVLRR